MAFGDQSDMDMKKSSIVLLAATLLGVAALAYQQGRDATPAAIESTGAPNAAATRFDQNAPIEERLAALESALSIERQARQLVQEELVVMTAELERLLASASGTETTTVATASAENETRTERRGRSRGNSREGRSERMVEAGFTPAEAERILRRESELQMEVLEARYEARRSGDSSGFFGNSVQRGLLRDELGDDAYARYLSANGRPTRVSISTVLEGSPALSAGLQPGDQIVSYDGRRVFSMDEITQLQMAGEAGQNVLVDIEREGLLMQVSMPRGPLGVTGGRRFR